MPNQNNLLNLNKNFCDGKLNPELVFFDTFSHENNEEINLDLVQFRSPVVIKEIRIIPLGAKVEADFPGGWRLGATNPSSFDVLFYINDLTKSSLNKFTKFGNFNYKESLNIKFVPGEITPTNSLVLKGKYTVLTLAVFANVIDENSITNEEEILKISHKQNINDNFPFETNFSKEKTKNSTSIEIESRSPEIKIKQEKLNGTELEEKKLSDKLKKEINLVNTKSEIQSISSPTEDFPSYNYEFSNENKKTPENSNKKSLDNLNDSDSISSLDEETFKKEKIIPSSPLNVKSSAKSVTNDSDFEPISPEQTDPQESLEVSDTEKRNYFAKNSPQNDLLFINNLTEKVSDDEISDFNNDEFFETEKIVDPRIDSRASTNSEDLEAISSEEEYFDKSSNEGEIFEDYSDNEINNIKYKYEFDSKVYECTPIKSFNDVSFTNYGNIWLKKNFSDVLKRKNLVNEIKEFETNNVKDHKWIEYIESLLPNIDYIDLNDQQLVSILISWINVGINFDCAINQEKTAFKIRHLKAGLKLLNTLCQTTSKLIEKLLQEKILEKVYLLFFKPYMSFSMKLLLIKTLDYFLNHPIAIEHIFKHKYSLESFETLKDEFKNEKKTIYELLLILTMKTTETLVSFSLSVLLRKIHFFEFLMDFKEKYQCFPNDSNLFVENLKETTILFKNSNKIFNQRSRYLPAKVQFEIDYDSSTESIMYIWFNHLNFYEIIIDLLEKEIKNEKLVFTILDFLDEIFHQQNGLVYFSSLKCVSLTNRLFKIKINENESKDLSENEEKNKLNSANFRLKEFILKLKISLHILELVDQINEIQECSEFNSNIFYDETKLCQLYNKLYSMVFDELGSKCLVKVFCDKKNLNILIKFLSCNRERENNNKTSKLICFHYAINLLVHIIQFSKEKLCELFIKYNEELINLSNILSTSKFSTLSKWLSPLKRGIKINHSEITFKLLTSNLKQHFERLKDLKENCTYRVSPDLISCVQILHWLCISKEKNTVYCDDSLPESQLKYKYGLIQLYTLKGTTYILTILEKLSEIFLKPSHLNSSLISNQGYYLITLFEPCIEILKQTILNLTHSRGSCFKDTSPIIPLLKVYSLMLIFPLQSSFYSNSVKICNEVIIILQSYTQLNVNINEVEDEVFNKSVWTKMVKEVISFTTLKPFNFSHGLYLLSQLLPLPLSVKKTDNLEETAKLLNFRKLWSAHIHVLFNDIENMLQKLVLCLSPLIKCLLKRVSYQLVDLSSHAGIIISKCLISVLDQHISKTDLNESKDNLESVLDLISFLLKFNLFKNAFSCTVNSLNSSIKKDEKFEKTIRKAIDLFKQNQELSEKYAVILSILDSKKELSADNELDLNQIEKLNLHYNSREENICLEEDFDDLSKILDLTKKLNKFDLFNLSKKYLEPSFDVRNKLLILYKNEEPNFEENYKLTNKHKHEPLITKDYSSSIKRPYVAPLRGRGFQRSTNIGGRLHDPFRSRPPNTSRPPSMHVDDFVAMEQNNQNNIKRQKQDFNKFKINQGQRNNQRPVYYNNNFRAPNSRNNNLNNRTSFNRYSNITISYNNNNSLNNNNVNNNTSNNNSNNNRIRKFPETFSVS